MLQLLSLLAATPVLVATVVVGGWITPGYSHLADTVSRLASPGQPHAWFASAGFVLYGCLVLVGAPSIIGLAHRWGRTFVLLVAGYGAAAVVAGFAPKDPPGPIHTTTSAVHVAATVVGGAMVITAMALLAITSTDRRERIASATIAAVAVVGAITFRFVWGSALYGALERLVLAAPSLWLSALAWREIRTGDGPPLPVTT